MKKFAFLPVAVLAVLGSVTTMQSCSEAAKKIHYDLPLQPGALEVTIPPTNDTTNVKNNLAANSVHVNIDSFIRAKTGGRLGIDNITSVRILSVRLTLVNGNAANNFANFQSAFASFSSTSNMTPYSVTIPNNPDLAAYFLELPVDPNKDMRSYMTGDVFYYSVGGKLRRPVTQEVKCKIEFQFNIAVNG
jgi:hypothetical protein